MIGVLKESRKRHIRSEQFRHSGPCAQVPPCHISDHQQLQTTPGFWRPVKGVWRHPTASVPQGQTQGAAVPPATEDKTDSLQEVSPPRCHHAHLRFPIRIVRLADSVPRSPYCACSQIVEAVVDDPVYSMMSPAFREKRLNPSTYAVGQNLWVACTSPELAVDSDSPSPIPLFPP